MLFTLFSWFKLSSGFYRGFALPENYSFRLNVILW